MKADDLIYAPISTGPKPVNPRDAIGDVTHWLGLLVDRRYRDAFQPDDLSEWIQRAHERLAAAYTTLTNNRNGGRNE